MSPAIRLIGDVDTVRVARTAQAKMGVVRGDLLVLCALSEVDFPFCFAAASLWDLRPHEQ